MVKRVSVFQPGWIRSSPSERAPLNEERLSPHDAASVGTYLENDLSEYPGVPTSSEVQRTLEEMNDTARYTFKVGDATYAQDVSALIEKLQNDGFEPFGTAKNGWGADGYKGINSTWIDSSTGQKFEVQVHTAESLEAKETTHPLYEEERAPSTSPERRAELHAIQNHIFDSVPIPDGAADVFWPKPSAVHVPATSKVDSFVTGSAGEER